MLKGVDISQWQGVGTGDGADFVIVKATEGNCYTDPVCDQHYQRAKANGQLRGFYHFARPDGNDPISEADYFVNECLGYFKDGIPVLDWEVNTWNVGWAKQWLDRVYARTGVRPLIYMSASVVNGNNWSSVSNDYGLWIAGYPAQYDVPNPPVPSENELPYDIGSWAFAVMWQYTSSAGRLDRDVAYIDAVAWSKYAGSYVAEQPKQEQPKPVETPKVEEPKKEEPTKEEEPKDESPIIEPEPIESAKKTDLKTYEKAMKKLQKKGVAMPFTLPQKVYEFLRWGIAILLPAVGLLLELLNNEWGWGLPIEPIKTTLNGIGIFLGTIFCISYTNNKKNGE